jgi:type II secretory pathway component PulL
MRCWRGGFITWRFDLFTGAWEAREAVRLGISRWVVLPCLVLTFLFGPLGLALFLLVKLAMRRSLGAEVLA